MRRAEHFYEIQNVLSGFAPVACSIAPILDKSRWIVIQPEDRALHAMVNWERRFGRERARWEYNSLHLGEIRRTLRTSLGNYRGFSDLFVPIVRDGRCESAIAAGPFRTRTFDSEELLRQWAELAGRHAHPDDADLLAYARSTLRTQLLEPDELAAFRRLLEALARALVDPERAASEFETIQTLRRSVFGRRAGARQWKAALMLDPVSNAYWPHERSDDEQLELGITRIPNTVIATMPEKSETGLTALECLLRADDFQRRADALSRRFENTLSAPLDEYGAYFLFHIPAHRNPATHRLALLDRARAIGKAAIQTLGVRLRLGVSEVAASPRELPELARKATVALQLAAHYGHPLEMFDDETGRGQATELGNSPATELARLREMVKSATPSELGTHHTNYLRAVLEDSGGRIDRIRMHLEQALEGLVVELARSRAIEAGTAAELRRSHSESLARDVSSHALARTFQDSIVKLLEIATHPSRGELELRLRRAVRYIDEHCGDTLTLTDAARVAGMSRAYFSRQFKELFALGFAEQLRRARVERSKRLLYNSEIAIHRVATLSGFASVPHFNRVFRELTGTTPKAFRAAYVSPTRPNGRNEASTRARRRPR